jgi:hypothetical protein
MPRVDRARNLGRALSESWIKARRRIDDWRLTVDAGFDRRPSAASRWHERLRT